MKTDNALESQSKDQQSNNVGVNLHPNKIRIVAQGGLLKVSSLESSGRSRKAKKQVKRGKVAGMSQKSRKRLLEHVATLSSRKNLIFITVTYVTAPTTEQAKVDLHNFLQRIYRRAPKAAVIWKMEFQQRGAIHFHFLAFNLPYWNKRQLQKAWGETIGQDRPFTRIEMVRGKKKALAYVCKYMAKSAKSSGFNDAPYPNAWTGRTWGFRQKENFEYASRTVIDLLPMLHKGYLGEEERRIYFALRKRCAKEYPPIAFYEHLGFTLFTERAIEFLPPLDGYAVTAYNCTTDQ